MNIGGKILFGTSRFSRSARGQEKFSESELLTMARHNPIKFEKILVDQKVSMSDVLKIKNEKGIHLMAIWIDSNPSGFLNLLKNGNLTFKKSLDTVVGYKKEHGKVRKARLFNLFYRTYHKRFSINENKLKPRMYLLDEWKKQQLLTDKDINYYRRKCPQLFRTPEIQS